MTHDFASIMISDDAQDTDLAALTFIEDVEYEFVGGGTAVNSD